MNESSKQDTNILEQIEYIDASIKQSPLNNVNSLELTTNSGENKNLRLSNETVDEFNEVENGGNNADD